MGEHPLRGTPNQGLAGATFGFFLGFAAVSLFGPTASVLRETLDLSPFAMSWLVAAPALSGSLLRIPFSAWVDTSGGRRPFVVLLCMAITGMTGLLGVLSVLDTLAGAPWLYPLLLLLAVLAGSGIATFSVGIGQVSYWFPQQAQGRALGAFAGIGNLAPGALAFVLPYALVQLGLTGTYLIWLLLLVGGTAVYAATARNAWYFQLTARGTPPGKARTIAANDHGQELFPSGNALDGLRRSARVWKTWALVAIYFTTFGGFIALTSWLPTYWQSAHGLALTTAGALTAVYSIGASLVRVPGGWASDWVGGERTLMASLSVVLFGAVLLTSQGSFAPALLGEVCLAAGMGVANAAVFKLVPQEVPEAVGGAAGWVGGLGAFGGFAIPPMMAAFVGAFGPEGYSLGFAVFIGLAALSLGIGATLTRASTGTVAVDPAAAPRLEKLGGLVAGLAHELSTPLGISTTAASQLRSDLAALDDQDERPEAIEAIGEANALILANLERMNRLVRRLQQLATDEPSVATSFDLRDQLQATLFAVAPLLDEAGVTVELACPDDLQLRSHPDQLGQIVTNLCTNAVRHAFTTDGGTVRLKAAAADGDVVITFADDGVGMDEDVRRRVFEPFFTTGRHRGGMGLGMHLVSSLAHDPLGGSVTCESAPGAGTTFTLRVPRAPAPASPPSRA